MSETLRAADSEDLPAGLGLVGSGSRRRGRVDGGGGSISSQNNMSSQQQQYGANKQYKIDLYSVPVFVLEILILAGLAYAAFLIHFHYSVLHQPFISGFY